MVTDYRLKLPRDCHNIADAQCQHCCQVTTIMSKTPLEPKLFCFPCPHRCMRPCGHDHTTYMHMCAYCDLFTLVNIEQADLIQQWGAHDIVENVMHERQFMWLQQVQKNMEANSSIYSFDAGSDDEMDEALASHPVPGTGEDSPCLRTACLEPVTPTVVPPARETYSPPSISQALSPEQLRITELKKMMVQKPHKLLGRA